MFKLVCLTRKFLRCLLILSLPLCIHSCSGGRIDPFDYDTGLTRNEAFDTVIKKREKKKKLSAAEEKKANEQMAPIPKMSKLIVSPPPPVVGGDKIISFSTTDQVPLKDVLIEFGRMVQIDVDVDPNISGGIILNAKNRPLKEVIDRIATLGNLRYSYNNGVLRFESDTPYVKNYFVDYLTGGTLWTDVEANITAILSAEGGGGGSSEEDTGGGSGSFTSNKSAGIISIFGTGKQHKAIAQYLSDVEKYASAQVLIEAKLVEVNLKKEYIAGINWTRADGLLAAGNGFTAPTADTGVTAALSVTLRSIMTSDISAAASALEKFGSTKTIASPRIHAINNQKATLNFTDKYVYFQVQQTQSNTSTTGTSTALVASTVSSTKLEESIGTTLEIVPSINLKTGEVTMDIKPKLSVLSDTVTDPASPRDSDGNVVTELINTVPVIQTREITTSAKVQSGNVLVIGGLMKDQAENDDVGVPLLGRIPVLGWLFKSVTRYSSVTETVIFIKATIVNSGSPAHKVDRDIQKNFDPTKREFIQ